MSSSSNDLSRSFQRSDVASALFADARLRRVNISNVPSTKPTGGTSSNMAQATTRKAFQEHLNDAGTRTSQRAAEQRGAQRDRIDQKSLNQKTERQSVDAAPPKKETQAVERKESKPVSYKRDDAAPRDGAQADPTPRTVNQQKSEPAKNLNDTDTVINQTNETPLPISDVGSSNVATAQTQNSEALAAQLLGEISITPEKDEKALLDAKALSAAINADAQPIASQLIATPQMTLNPIVGSGDAASDAASATQAVGSAQVLAPHPTLAQGLKEAIKNPEMSQLNAAVEQTSEIASEKLSPFVGKKEAITTDQAADLKLAQASLLEKHISNDQKAEKLDQALNALSKALSPEAQSLGEQRPSDHLIKSSHDAGALQRLSHTAHAAEKAAPEPATTLNQVPLEIGLKVLSGSKRFDIRLDPPELGRIEVKLDLSKNGEVNAQLVVDRVETLTLLQRDARTLERAFEQIGLKAGEGGINLSLRDPSGDGQKNNSHSERDHNTHTRGRNSEPALSPEISSPMKRYVWRSPTGVDMHV